jgi:two-component system, LytTR family, sensor kinase
MKWGGAGLPPRWVAHYLATWTALAIVFVGQSLLYALQAHAPFRAGAALLSSTLYWYLWALLGLVVLRLAARFPLGGRGFRRHAAVHALTGILVAGCHVLLRAAAERAFNGNSADGVRTFFVEQFHLDLLVYWGIVGASHAFAFHREAVTRAAEAGALASRGAHLEAMIATARLNALRAQLEPHFLFNTLQAVSTLMRGDVELADRTLGQLSALLRRIVDAADVQEVPLDDELQLAGEYLAIQAVRFQAHLAVETHVEPEIEKALVPILIMQPLIENACVHGIGRHPAGGRVILRAERARDGAGGVRSRGLRGVLRLSVTNDGPEPPATGSALREGIGLSNTRKRLEALYGEHQMIAVTRRPGGGVEAVIEIPLHWSSDPPETTLPLEAAHA